ncbi:pyroglutamylated RF-amide peptide receptor-like [Oculina patagonica]
MPESADVAIAVIHAILFFLNIVGNSLVCAIIKKNRDMRIPINYLLVNLAIADILYAAFIAPEVILRITITHPGGIAGSVLCKLVTAGIFAWIGGISSVVTLVVIAFERYYAVIHPYDNRKLNKSKLKVIIPGSWIFSLLINMPLFLVVNVKGNSCVNIWISGEDWMPKAYDLMWSGMIIVCVLMMVVLYSRIVYTLWFKQQYDNQPAFQNRGVLRVRKRVTLMVITVTALFGICWVSDVIAHGIDYYTSLRVSEATYPVIHTMVLLNSAVNPFVYALMNKTFREKMQGMVSCSCTGSTGSVEPNAGEPQIIAFNNKMYRCSIAGTSSSE